MKNKLLKNSWGFTFQKSLATFILFLSLTLTGQVTLPHLDPISYTAGTALQTQSGWTSLNAGDDLAVTAGSLSYSGLAASAGNKVAFDGAGIDAAKAFTQQTSGTVYYSFLLNVSSLGSLNTTGGYLTGLNEGTTTNFGATVWTRSSGVGYNIGINPRTTVANTAWSSSVQTVGTTVLVVISYQIVAGSSNDVVKMWINPTPGGTEPAATLSATNTGTDLLNLNRIFIRQDATTTTPFVEMDELRVGTTWASVTPAGSSCAAPALSSTVSATQNITGDIDFTGSVTNAGGGTSITKRGFQISTNANMSSATDLSENSSSTGSYTLNTILTGNTRYYYRSYAINNCAVPQTGYSSATPVSTSIVTKPFSTTANAATNVSSKSFRANWTNPGVGTETFTYKLFVYADDGLGNYSLFATYTSIPSGTTFYDVTGLTPNTNYRYNFRSNNSAGDSELPSNTINVTTLTAATKLAYSVSPPATGNAGVNLTSFTVQAQRADNSVDTDFSGTVTLSRNIVSGSGTLGGTTTAALSGGAATFGAVNLSSAGTYTITASLSGLTSATSGNIIISAVSAATDYFRTSKSGNWSDTASATTPWESSTNGTSDWHTATLAPGTNASAVTIQSGHNIVINTTGIVITKTQVYGSLETGINNFSVNGIADGIELTIKNGGSFITNGDGYANAGNAYGLVETGGKLVALSGSGSTFAQRYIEASFGLFYFGNNAICEWQNSSTNLGSADTNYFSAFNTGDIAIFRIVNSPAFAFGSSTSNVLNAKIEVNSNIVWDYQGNGNKTFVGGLQGTGSLTINYASGTGKVIFGTSGNIPTLGNTGKLTFTFPSNKIEFPNGANVPLAAEVVLQSAAQNNYLSRTGGTITVNGILDLSNIRIINSATGSISVNGTLKTSNTGGLKATGLGNIQEGTLALNANSIVDYYATANQTVSSNPSYYNIIFSGAGIKTPSSAISVDTNGSVKVTGTTTADFTSNNLASTSANTTAFQMDGGRLILGTGGAQPNMRGTYNLTGGVVEFKGSSSQTIRSKSYQNIEVSGTDVGNSSGNITLNSNGTFTVVSGGLFTINDNSITSLSGANAKVIVKNGGTFKTGNTKGLHGFTATFTDNSAVHSNITDITLENGSTVEYSKATAQTVSDFTPGYYNLNFTGTGEKTAANLKVNNLTTISAGILRISETADNVIPNVFYAHKGISNTGGNVILETNANLMQDATGVSNFGNIEAKRKAKLPKLGYNYWSSPVSNQNLYAFSDGGGLNGTPKNRFWQYDEATDLFKNTGSFQLNDLSVFESGKGYAIRGQNQFDAAVPTTSYEFTFTGTPHNGSLSFVNLKYSGPDKGYNLVGNPYPSHIDFDELYNINSSKIYATAYFWTNNDMSVTSQQGSGYQGNNYAVYNLTGGAPAVEIDPAPGQPALASSTPNNIIKVGQGFIIKAKIAGSNQPLNFTNAVRVAESGIFFNNKLSVEKNRFWLKLKSPANITNTILIGYIPTATNDFEIDYDAELFVVGSDSFYSTLGSKKLAIQGKGTFDIEDKVGLGNVYSQNGNYTVSLKNAEGIFSGNQNIYLKDKLLNKVVNLSNSDYTFQAVKGTDNSRFEIVFKEDAVLGTDSATKSDFEVYRDGTDYVINSSKILVRIDVYDVTGRLVISKKSTDRNFRLDSAMLSNGVYIIKAENSGDVRTKKVIK
ncbi:T9SS type A sorting domain-containing protein [Epilithonimonas sp. JDS]|uniref:T9SS type A sorting domain-containing protein n=1 Tax=Epilithonimonas sp. JDS TaxID=2902797 RepID=UPI001E56E6AD|nr:T9SS type A sorting domain-containing protein [Epilithonimonas sp. JDS]MCD9853451.1 T9SS type A sorting domain-containing protein [Epilithonimonas sp. JDS]